MIYVERFKRIDLAIYVTKVHLHFPSHICLELQGYACLSWSSGRIGDLSGSDSQYRASESMHEEMSCGVCRVSNQDFEALENKPLYIRRDGTHGTRKRAWMVGALQ